MIVESTDLPAAGRQGNPKAGRIGAFIAGDVAPDPGTPGGPQRALIESAAAELPEGRRFKKPNEAIGFKVKGALTLGYLHRKVLNVMMATAQQQKQPGRYLPPAHEIEETWLEYFWSPLSDYCKDAGYDSKDLDTFKKAVSDLQELRLVRDERKDFLSEIPIASVRIVMAGGQWWVGVSLAPEAKASITRPRTYTPMLLYYQNVLSSGPAVALYEICRRYLTNKVPYTMSQHWSEWYYQLSGKPIGSKLPEFKYWRRDTLRRIEVEINTKTDIHITRHEDRGGRRRAGELQYHVVENEQTKLEFPGPPPIDSRLLQRVMDLGVPQRQAEELVHRYDEGRLLANLQIVEKAKRERRVTATPLAFLTAALEGNYAGKEASAKQTVQSEAARAAAAASARERLRERFATHRAREALRLLQEMAADARAEVEEEHRAQAPATIRSLAGKGNQNAYRMHLGSWYAEKVWGSEVSEEDLLEFATAELARNEAARR